MKQWRAMGAMLTVLLFGGAVFIQAQHDQDSRRTEQNQRNHEPAARAGESHRGAAPAQRGSQRPPRQVQRSARERTSQEAQQRQVWQQHRLPPGRMPDNWSQRGGYHGRQIPAAVFGSHFGFRHRFHVYSLPFQEVAGVPRFQYGGYWFELASPAPAYWGPDWYRSDDMFIVSAYGGYYLDNARFPNRPGIAVSVIF